MVKCAFKNTVSFANSRGRVNIQRRTELLGQLVDWQAVAVEFVIFVCEAGRASKHEGEIVAGEQLAISHWQLAFVS